MDESPRQFPGLAAVSSLLEKADFGVPNKAPRVALVAGSGMSGIGDMIDGGVDLSFSEIEGLGSASVAGHAGRWRVGALAGAPVHFLAGRRHYYEGATSAEIIHSTRLLAALGVRLIVLTNAAGSLAARLRAGDIMMIRDQINLSFRNPLLGPNDESRGPRFPDLSDAFDPAAQAIVRKRSQKAGIALEEGVYAQVLGPNYETRSEIEMLRRLGAHAVGMSTVPEVLAARHARMRVLAFSLITNLGLGRGVERGVTSHEEVLAVADRGRERMLRLFETILPSLERLAHSPAYAR
jgi:purine-nucleoside phosphorylase